MKQFTRIPTQFSEACEVSGGRGILDFSRQTEEYSATTAKVADVSPLGIDVLTTLPSAIDIVVGDTAFKALFRGCGRRIGRVLKQKGDVGTAGDKAIK